MCHERCPTLNSQLCECGKWSCTHCFRCVFPFTRGQTPDPFKCFMCQLAEQGVDEDLRRKIKQSLLACSSSRASVLTMERLNSLPQAPAQPDEAEADEGSDGSDVHEILNEFVHVFSEPFDQGEEEILRAYQHVVIQVLEIPRPPNHVLVGGYRPEENHCFICHAEYHGRDGNEGLAICASCRDGDPRWLPNPTDGFNDCGDYFLVPHGLTLTETEDDGYIFTQNNEPVLVAVHTYEYDEWHGFRYHRGDPSSTEIREFITEHGLIRASPATAPQNAILQTEYARDRFFRQGNRQISREPKSCAICLDELEIERDTDKFPHLVLTRCGHNFHKACWEQHIEASKTPSCPQCRETA